MSLRDTVQALFWLGPRRPAGTVSSAVHEDKSFPAFLLHHSCERPWWKVWYNTDELGLPVWCWVRSPLHSSRHISLLQHFGLDLRQLSPASKRPDARVLRSATVLCGDMSVLMCSTFVLVLAEKGGDRMRHYQLQGAWSAILRWLVLTVVILTLHLKLTNRTHFCGGWPKSQCPATCHQSALCIMQCLWGCLVQQQHCAALGCPCVSLTDSLVVSTQATFMRDEYYRTNLCITSDRCARCTGTIWCGDIVLRLNRDS